MKINWKGSKNFISCLKYKNPAWEKGTNDRSWTDTGVHYSYNCGPYRFCIYQWNKKWTVEANTYDGCLDQQWKIGSFKTEKEAKKIVEAIADELPYKLDWFI